MRTATLAALLFALAPLPARGQVAFESQEDRLQITVDGRPFADYVLRDGATLRPHFTHLHAPGGVQVTRTHPPVAGKDATDHATMHPGLWLAFGDLSGADFWRNKATVRHAGFVGEPAGGPDSGTFAVRNVYESGGQAICTETCLVTIRKRPSGHLILWDSEFRSDRPFTFGDQEEMGLGFRVATPLTVENGGLILDSEGRKNGKEVWGKSAAWCDYSGAVDGRRVGLLLMPDPRNFRPSWFHARDYGLLVANPFGRQAMTGGDKSAVTVRPGEAVRLRFGVLLHAGETDLPAAYADYLRAAGVKN